MYELLSRLDSDTPSSKRTHVWSVPKIGFKNAVTPTMKMRQSNLKFYFVGVRPRSGAIRSARLIVLIAFVSGLWVSAPRHAVAEGFRILPPGTFNLGRAGGRIAQIDDSSAVHQNPANLVDLANPEVQFSPAMVYLKSDFTSGNGQTSSTEEPWKPLPNL